jgi:hypothetical protein
MLWWIACWCSRAESLNLEVDFKGSQRRKEREGCRMCASVNSSAGFLGGASKLRYWGVDRQATKRRRSATCYATLKTVKPSFTGLQPNARLSDNSIFPRWRFRILFKSPIFVVAIDAADVMRLGRTELEVSRLGIGMGRPGKRIRRRVRRNWTGDCFRCVGAWWHQFLRYGWGELIALEDVDLKSLSRTRGRRHLWSAAVLNMSKAIAMKSECLFSIHARISYGSFLGLFVSQVPW